MMKDTLIRDYSAFIAAAFGDKGCAVSSVRMNMVENKFMHSLAVSNVTAICIPRSRGTKEIFGK